MKIRVYDNKGRERWMNPGQRIPVGWYDSKCRPVTKDSIVSIGLIDDSNPYDEVPLHIQKHLYIKEL